MDMLFDLFIFIVILLVAFLVLILTFTIEMLFCREGHKEQDYSEVSQIAKDTSEALTDTVDYTTPVEEGGKKCTAESYDATLDLDTASTSDKELTVGTSDNDADIESINSEDSDDSMRKPKRTTLELSKYVDLRKAEEERCSPIEEYDDDASLCEWDRNQNIYSNSNFSFGNYTNNSHVQASIIYDKEKRYIAGKIIQITDIPYNMKYSPLQIRIHVVVFPIKKHALKTNWYEILDDGKVEMDEYFKFVFLQPPPEKRARIRIRAYIRSIAVGSSCTPECIGESYVNMIEIRTAGGGKTIWRSLLKGVASQTIPEEPIGRVGY